jgi:hypothetical protein
MSESFEAPEGPPLPDQKPPESWKTWRLKWRGRAWLFWPEWVLRWIAFGAQKSAVFKVLELAGRLIIVIALIQWWMERGDRLEAKHNQAWTLIVLSRGAGGDAGRKSALEHLAADGVSLNGAPLDGAVITELVLTGVYLTSATFTKAKLGAVYFKDSFLSGVDFQNAQLDNGGFMYTSLVRANFDNAILEAPFTFMRSDARGATFRHARLQDVSFLRTNLTDADFTGASVFDGYNRPITLVQLLDSSSTTLCHTTMPDSTISNRDCPTE